MRKRNKKKEIEKVKKRMKEKESDNYLDSAVTFTYLSEV